MSMKKLLLTALLALSTFIVAGQTLNFSVGFNSTTRKIKLSKVEVTIYEGDQLISRLPVEKKNKISTQLAVLKEYKIVVSCPGAVSRNFMVDLTGVTNVDRLELSNVQLEMKLFPEEEGVDYSFILENPLTTVKCNEDCSDLTYDREAIKAMYDELERLGVDLE